VPISTVTGTIILEPFKSFPDITNNYVNYIHGNGDYLCVATISGVDRYKFSTNEREYTFIEQPNKCFQTTVGDYYYYVNPSFNVVGLDDNLFAWNYGKEITLSTPIPEDDYQLLIEIPIIYRDNIYDKAAENGIDVRIIDGSGRRVPHYIERWDYENSPKVWVKLYKDTEKLYLIYGNEEATDLSNAEETFRLYDHFDGDTLSDIWIFDNEGYSGNYYTIANSKITFRTVNNDYTIFLTSSKLVLGGMLEYSVRMIPNTNNDDLDWNAMFVGGVHTYIGVSTDTTEYPHRIVGVVQGTKYLKSSFTTHTIIESPTLRSSSYDGETLTSTGVFSVNNRAIRFYYHSAENRPDTEIDWVRVRSYDPNPPTLTINTFQDINTLFDSTKLYAVYKDGGSYIYDAKQNNIIESSYINDIYITENTSIYGGNVIFIATAWGIYVIEERRGQEDSCRYRIYLIET
jgi:hypothetical protein